ncbi:hypothetical protein QYE76_005804 [Lolium multiflorum]|uniref:Carboxypeptidase n=1 Tax=Lolium multiflorum TaxID=4521 RepID=A0AAD8W2L5_LOLMU|nr:hypothetical protein QYE76_005804 [Lolium multiflorum]
MMKVGNPYLDDNINIKGRVDFFWTHGVMSDEVYTNVTKHCNFDSAVETPSLEAACNGALDVFHEGDIDAYNIYAPRRAHASQEDALRAFISSRKMGEISSSGAFKARNIADRVASSLSAAKTSSAVSHKAADKIRALPGQPQGVNFDQYGGYVTVDEVNGRALFYYFVQAPTSGAAEKPLLLWLSGGPGCSSLGYGAMQELGPFRVSSQDNKTLIRNLNAWNSVANVIFLESPAGVGYSYSNTSADYDLSGDQRTADDAYIFLVKWLERFPEFKNRAFYISGESYAGHYVPELAATILLHNTYNNRTIVNLKGILMHANASQEAQLKAFISSRKNSVSSTDTFKVRNIADRVAASLSTESSLSDQSSLKAADKITALPGQPQGVDFDQYGGYVTVDEENGRALFYYLVEAPSSAAEKPLVLWLNGGCSSLGYGAMQELGPFRVSEDNKTLTRNVNAWNNVANVIFLESPAGVGFSYSNTSSDYNLSGDERTADDAYVFLVKWLERFPEYKGRAFYISGESFAGHYVPELAATILLHNTYNNRTIVNLQGVLVGNPYLDANRNIKGGLDFLWTHAMMSDEVYQNVTKNCDFDNLNGTLSEPACRGALDGFHSGHVSAYNIYAPVCLRASNGAYYPSSYLPGYDPCSDYPTTAYLNDPAVQSAFHARTTKWAGCADLDWNDSPMSMLPTIKFLIEHKLPVWIFSGDFDYVCSLPGTRYTIQDLGLPVTTSWRPWTAKEEVGGYVQQYSGGFTFLSVRGAGHMVPSFQPERALTMLSYFLQGVLPPYIEQQ